MSSLSLIAEEIILFCIEQKISSKKELIAAKNKVCQKYACNTFPDTELLAAFDRLEQQEKIPKDHSLRAVLQKRKIRTLSGVAPISVLMPPAKCNSNCVYCPSERADKGGKTLFQKDTEKKYGKQNVPKRFQKPGALVMPKSYISSEPGAMRALLAGFDPYIQITRRLKSLEKTGHKAEKCELIVQGGTFSDLPKKERNHFIKGCYQAFNQEKNRQQTREEAIKKNETAKHRIIGLTLETRPGCITEAEIREFRELGCTRVEIGVQTLDDGITRKTKRMQTREEVKRATALLRQAGFKICYHLMPNLPFSTPEKDLKTFSEVCNDPDFKPDFLKIYPCSVVPFSELQAWYAQGKYEPYSAKVLFDLLYEMKKTVPPWIRINRLIRDIPGTAILGGNKTTNLNQLIQEEMERRGDRCRDIRSREIRDQAFEEKEVSFTSRPYSVFGGEEHFLSFELRDESLLALLRLFLPEKNQTPVFTILKNAALVRELHSFGTAKMIGESKGGDAQHRGLGKELLQKAEDIAKEKGYEYLAIISGIGVREYYRKLGYREVESYMVKKL